MREARDQSADDAALDEELEAARPDDEALRAVAAPIGPALPAASQQGIGVLSVGQGEAMRGLGVPGAAAPAPDSLEPGSPAATVGIEDSVAAQGPGSAPGIGEPRGSAPGSSAGLAGVPTVGPAIGPAALARAEAARAEVAPEGPLESPSTARENALDASAASRAVSAAAPDRRLGGGRGSRAPAEPVGPELGAAVSAAAAAPARRRTPLPPMASGRRRTKLVRASSRLGSSRRRDVRARWTPCRGSRPRRSTARLYGTRGRPRGGRAGDG